MKTHLEVFCRVAERLQPSLARRHIEVHTGTWLDSMVLKLQKPQWSLKKPAAAPTEAGIFFSIWTNAQTLKRNRVCYNIHALRLRKIRGYALQSREFAAAFRDRFEPVSSGWPNVSMDHGPQTLIEGWIELNPPGLEDDVADLATRFIPLAGVIDVLLAQRARPGVR